MQSASKLLYNFNIIKNVRLYSRKMRREMIIENETGKLVNNSLDEPMRKLIYGYSKKNVKEKNAEKVLSILNEAKSLNETVEGINTVHYDSSSTALSNDDLEDMIKSFHDESTFVSSNINTTVSHKSYNNFMRRSPLSILDKESEDLSLRSVLLPLYNLEEDERLLVKEKIMMIGANTLTEELNKVDTTICRGRFPFRIKEIRHMTDFNEKMNATVFDVNCGVDGNPKTVGIYWREYETERDLVLSPQNFPLFKNSHLDIAMAFQDFIRKSKFDAYINGKGAWKGITIKSSETTGEIMIIIKLNKYLSVHERTEIRDQLEEFKSSLGSKIYSVYIFWSKNEDVDALNPRLEYNSGNEYITETVLGQNFCIYPNSFFPIFTNCSPLLFEALKDTISMPAAHEIIQIGCHSNYGLYVSENAEYVNCFDGNQILLDRAKQHAQQNNLNNVRFINGKKYSNIVNIIKNPQRSMVAVLQADYQGFNINICNYLRSIASIKKVVLTFNTLESAFKYISVLCKKVCSENGEMPRFIPNKLTPVDTMPQATNLTYILELVRRTHIHDNKFPEEEMKEMEENNKKY